MALFFENVLLDVILIVNVLFITVYLYFIRNFNFWKNNGVPYIKPTPFVGNLKEVFFQKLDIGTHLRNFYEEYKNKPYFGIFSFDRPTLIVNDLDIIKKIMVKDSSYFVNHIISVDDKVDPMFAKILFSLRGEKWKQVRTSVSPTFTSGKMKKMFHFIDGYGKELVEYLKKNSVGDTPIEAGEAMSKYTTDVITSCAFGIESNSLRNPEAEIRDNSRRIFEHSLLKGIAGLLMFFAPNLQNIFRLKFVDDDYANFLRRTVWNTVEYREKHGVVRNDFLDCMMELRKEGAQKKNMKSTEESFQMDGDDFVGMIFSFFIGGFETSASTLTFALYELSFKREIQERMRDEINDTMEKYNNKLSYESVQNMAYIEMVVSETLRKYPILGFLDRVCHKDYQLPAISGKGSFTLRAGTGVYIPLLGIHMDPQYFPEPDMFDPERFTEENKSSRPNNAYMPFGDGPRICIGARFGLMQVKLALIHIISNFNISPSKNTTQRLVFTPKSFLVQPAEEIYLNFEKISK